MSWAALAFILAGAWATSLTIAEKLILTGLILALASGIQWFTSAVDRDIATNEPVEPEPCEGRHR